MHLVLVGAAGGFVFKGFATHGALEELLVRVEQDMAVHALYVFKDLMAHFALKDKVVFWVHGPSVVDDGVMGLEDFSALGTHGGVSVFGVAPFDVLIQGPLGVETLVALGALVRQLPGMLLGKVASQAGPVGGLEPEI